ncbi:putative membrane-bound dehydrogenase-like protein [Roseimicrobium gellanilyticum]|uniref:Putative membrane-bound dehydrogenase-like protein n=1 Tax=Roseimicrobium gellanilyticum TaxID=748857 RepID=A0A366HP71_9BACT|nr:PVC-type heme-binding CxxCH protein [Roseimicrobium gellanilyticum]RBP44311.1 putative membrane-bound dehydrogenase-like protein [Roseimicrobium gellanilyticum]
MLRPGFLFLLTASVSLSLVCVTFTSPVQGAQTSSKKKSSASSSKSKGKGKTPTSTDAKKKTESTPAPAPAPAPVAPPALPNEEDKPVPVPPLPSQKLQLHKWSGALNVPDPVAVTVDPQGRVYVTQTTRRKVGDLDIREHTQWIPNDVAMESIEQKKAFYHDVLAPGKTLRPRGSLKDHNKDGSIDWKDLTVHTERIYRLEDTDKDGTADKITLFAEGFNTEVTGIAAGILYHDGWVYCTIAPDLWRLRDTNDDGVADEREVVAHGFGHHIAYAGHDMHGLTVGPDGRIYWTIGDKGVNVLTKEGKRVAKPHEGCVLRCEPDGKNFEIFAHGLRNVQEIAFDEHGNLFGVDNDADKTGEKERFVYITEGSDSGWRCTYQYMKGWIPWMDEGLWKPRFAGQPEYITPPLAQGHDGPAGFVFNPGTALAAPWRQGFFGNQFPSGKMNVFRVAPSGASFTVTQDATVNSGVMGIGMSWGPEGKLYLADWMGGYPLDELGAIWTVDDPTGTDSTERQETLTRLREGFSNPEAVEPLAYLGHADQRVRLAAQFEIVKRGEFARLEEVAKNANQPRLARIHALWGLGQGMRAGKVERGSVEGLITALAEDKDLEVRAQLAKVVGDSQNDSSFGAKLLSLLKDRSPRVRFQAAVALGKLQVKEATPELLAQLALNADKDAYLRHALVSGLTGCATTGELAATATHESRSVRLGAVLALRRRADGAVSAFLEDKDAAVATEAARAIHDDESIPAKLPELAASLDSKRVVPDAFTRRVLNANFRIGDTAGAERVVSYALREDAALPVRNEALTLLTLWCTPPPLDRADGRARTLEARDEKAIADVLRPHLDQLMALKDTGLKTLAIQILIAYKLPVEANVAAAAVMEGSAPAETRIGALQLLATQHGGSAELGKTLTALVEGKAQPQAQAQARGKTKTQAQTQPQAQTPETLRIAALEILAREKPEVAIEQAGKLLTSGSTLEKQKCLALLAELKMDAADVVLTREMEQLVAGKCPPSRQLDVLEAVLARSADVAVLKEKLDAFEATRAGAVGTVGAYLECLEGGSSVEGKDIALEHLAANCTACHRFDSKEGSTVGPQLSGIGAQKDRTYLLESLVNPVAQIAPGYGMVSVTLKDGKSYAGVVVKEDAENVELKLADGSVKKIDIAEVTVKTPPISVMPPMSAMLTKRQLRDLVAYLAGLKSGGGSLGSKKVAVKETETGEHEVAEEGKREGGDGKDPGAASSKKEATGKKKKQG